MNQLANHDHLGLRVTNRLTNHTLQDLEHVVIRLLDCNSRLVSSFRLLNVRLQHLQCLSTGDFAVLQ